MKGFSPRNLEYMLAFTAAWPERAIVQEAVAQIPWYHHIALLEKLDGPAEWLWYARQAMEYGRSLEAATAANLKELGYGG